MNSKTLNAVELRDEMHALMWIEFETVCLPGWVEFGFGEYGEPVKITGVLTAVENGSTMGRSWSRVTVRATAPAIRRPVIITSVLGAHKTVTVTELRG